MQSGQDPHSWSSNPEAGRISQPRRFPLRSEGSEPHIRLPSPGELHGEDEAPLTSGFENQ